MRFLQDHFATFGKYLGYHARTFGRRSHRVGRLGVCSGEGKATVALIHNGKLTGHLEDFTSLLDPPVRGDTIRGEWSSRINAVPPEERPNRVDSFRRKFLEAAGSKGSVRGALILDRPSALVVSDIWIGRRGDLETKMDALSALDNVRRAPKEKIDGWTGDDRKKDAWNWHLLLPTMEAPEPDQSYAKYLVFGAMAQDSAELEGWAEQTKRVEWDLAMTAHYATLRFLAQGFFEANVPCIVARVYQHDEKSCRAFLCGWNGSTISYIASNIDYGATGGGLAARAQQVADVIYKDLDARAAANKEVNLIKPARLSVYLLVPPTVAPPVANGTERFEIVALRKQVLCDPKGLFRSRCPDVAALLEGDVPGTPEMILAIWSALRLDDFAGPWSDTNPTDRLLTERYQVQQVQRTSPAMRRSAVATLSLLLLGLIGLVCAGLLYMDSGSAQDQANAAVAKSQTRSNELSKYGDTALRLEDLGLWRAQAERVPASAILNRLSADLPESLALREVRLRAVLNNLGNPTGYELLLSGFARNGTEGTAGLLGAVFPGGIVREVPPTNLIPGSTTADGTILAADDPNLQAWRVGINLPFAQLDPAIYKLQPVDADANAPTAKP